MQKPALELEKLGALIESQLIDLDVKLRKIVAYLAQIGTPEAFEQIHAMIGEIDVSTLEDTDVSLAEFIDQVEDGLALECQRPEGTAASGRRRTLV